MASRPKVAYSERKRQKSTFILTVNSPVYPPIQGKENRLFLRPFIAAKETGGLDFLIAHALLIVCHSLFEVVIRLFVNDADGGSIFLEFFSDAFSDSLYAAGNDGNFMLKHHRRILLCVSSIPWENGKDHKILRP